MRVLLAGATGVVGRHLLPLLVERGHQVTGLTRREEDADALRVKGVEAVVADARDRDALVRAVRDAAPEIVLHQLTDLSGGDRKANAELRRTGTRNLLDAALSAGVRRVVAQSISWAYEPGADPAVEGVPLDLGASEPRLTTVEGVAALESAVREAPEWVVLRYGLLYGPGTWYARDGLMAHLAQRGELVADGDISSFVHVDDAAAAAVEALEWPSGAVNVCDDEPASGHDWVPAFCRAVAVPSPPLSRTERNGWARGAGNHYAREHLNWSPRYPSWREGFTEL
jgi:nucleoside-diphosphate-sugar epimerase